MRHRKREKATKRLTLWHAGRRKGVYRIQEWVWLQHPRLQHPRLQHPWLQHPWLQHSWVQHMVDKCC